MSTGGEAGVGVGGSGARGMLGCLGVGPCERALSCGAGGVQGQPSQALQGLCLKAHPGSPCNTLHKFSNRDTQSHHKANMQIGFSR